MPAAIESFRRWLVPVVCGLLAAGIARWALAAAAVDEDIRNGVAALVMLAVTEGVRRARRSR